MGELHGYPDVHPCPSTACWIDLDITQQQVLGHVNLYCSKIRM